MIDIRQALRSRANSTNPFYEIIYADPPWQYTTTQKGNRGVAENHYSTMTLADLKALPVDSIAANDCALFMWATMPCLPEAFDVIEAWGFKYKTVAFTWVKTCRKSHDKYHIGLGHWTRSNAELCLLATKGKPGRYSKAVRSLLISPLEGHSKKPDCIRDKIIQLCGGRRRIELFARQKIDGWDSIGDEI